MFTKKQFILADDRCIRFDFKDFDQTYAVEIMIKEGEEQEETNVITYKVNVRYTKEHHQPYYIVEVTTRYFLLNFQTPDSMFQEIALTCRKTLEKCVFQVDQSNKIIALYNHDAIITTWKTIKTQLQQDNEGATFERYIDLFEKSLLDKNQLLQKLKKDPFIKHYFFPIFDAPYYGFERKGIEHFSFFDFDYEEEILLKVENEGIFDDNNTVLLSKTLIKNEKNTTQFPITAYQTTYQLDKNHAIQNIKGTFVNHNKEYLFEIEQKK
jgi:hypothetical protein